MNTSQQAEEHMKAMNTSQQAEEQMKSWDS